MSKVQGLRVAARTSSLFRLQGAALAQHDLGHDREAREALQEMTTRLAFSAAYQIAAVYARWDDKDAVEWLGRAIDQRDGGAPWRRSTR